MPRFQLDNHLVLRHDRGGSIAVLATSVPGETSRLGIDNFRRYGEAPFRVAVLHGGPGAPGSMAPVARELSSDGGVLEPLQSAASVEGQVEELRAVLAENANLPVVLVGHSWGAWLGYIFAARYSSLVRKLIMVGSGPFEEKYVAALSDTRLERLSSEERAELKRLEDSLDDRAITDKRALFARFGQLFHQTDSYAPTGSKSEVIEVQFGVYQSVWGEAAELRRSGELLALGKRIQCPVVAIHGDYDPHPAEGVQKPLASVLADFRFYLLKNCGHTPWLEREASNRFYRILREELS